LSSKSTPPYLPSVSTRHATIIGSVANTGYPERASVLVDHVLIAEWTASVLDLR
jgi:hypothetical protein